MEGNRTTDGNDTILSEGGPSELGLVGAVLEGRYLIERKLGEGGFGAVYLAADQKMVSRKVVVKVLHDETAKNDWVASKFKQEIEALTRINHPGIIGVFDTGQTLWGHPFIVMQYVAGVTLRSQITADGMSFTRAANIIGQIGRALNAAHQAGILHRDLKPENIMLESLTDEDEHVKIIDFGIAKIKNSVVANSTVQAQTVGTLYYMSPEQLSAQPLTPASDVYSFGVIAYEMVTGKRPVNPDSVFQLLEMQRSGVRVKPGDLRPSLPRGAEPAILKALSFEPQERFEKARDFAELLASALMGDDDPTRRQIVGQHPKSARGMVADSEAADSAKPETAHVLFMDIVGYSKSLIDQQRGRLRRLQEIVLATQECQSTNAGDLIRLPTGDGMALVFFGDPEAPVRCAVEVSRALKSEPEIELRSGVHSGLVYRIADVNTNMNVAGGGINVAQRVMDCGDSGHIILSKRVADDLGQLARWTNCLHDLGDFEVKHGLRVHVFNLYGDDFGNPQPPAKLTITQPPAVIAPNRSMMVVILLLVLGIVVAAGFWFALRPKNPPTVTAGPVTSAPAGPEQSLKYWLTVQKMLNKKPLGDPIESAGDISFGNGWKFHFNFRPLQSGALYLINVGPGKNGAHEYNVLFPLPENDRLDSRVAANETKRAGPYNFVDQTGVEKLWIIWSSQPVADLDSMFQDAVRNKNNPGVIVDPDQINKLQVYLKKYDAQRPEVIPDKARKLTLVKGRGEMIVNLVELSHEAY